MDERRQKLFGLLTRGMKGYEIAKELGVNSATVSRDIKYLIADSQTYLNDLAKQTVLLNSFICVSVLQLRTLPFLVVKP